LPKVSPVNRIWSEKYRTRKSVKGIYLMQSSRHSPFYYLFEKFLCYDFQKERKFMKFKMTPFKVCAAMILGIAAFGFSLSSLDNAVPGYERRQHSISCFPQHSSTTTSESLVSNISKPASEPLARLFQLLFILFIISPPIIAVMLFLIWKELKARNKMK